MRYWAYDAPDEHNNPVTHRYSEHQILAEYFPYWSKKMRELGREHLISEETCIEDWVVVNWAYPDTPSPILPP